MKIPILESFVFLTFQSLIRHEYHGLFQILNIRGTFHSINQSVLSCIPREEAFNGWIHTSACLIASLEIFMTYADAKSH